MADDQNAPGEAQALRILALLGNDQLDAAIEAGLARFMPLQALDAATNATLVDARDRLLAAWAARERHRARALRLERLAAERRRARRAPVAPAAPDAAVTSTPPAPALPAAAAAALARAKARASGQRP